MTNQIGQLIEVVATRQLGDEESTRSTPTIIDCMQHLDAMDQMDSGIGDDENDYEESHSMSFDDDTNGEGILDSDQGQQVWEVRDTIANSIFIAHS
ncbi:hypothetical protein MRB53_020616 [Persea americana]|uniref:Uncharacterized protein n=1 Tax=Persea americana TaxID=3435 RepID=A0ACC2L1F5_PERAE|nr:hypothetical protein MRB53_020616 [Persea americana]